MPYHSPQAKIGVSVREAQRIMRESITPLSPCKFPICQVLNRILRETIHAHYPSPPFTNSAMDGYGIALKDYQRDQVLRVSHVQMAGDPPPPPLAPGTAVQVMTGAMIPEGVEAVVPVEATRQEGEGIVIVEEPKKGQHIRYQGEEYPAGASLLEEGTPLTPDAIGLLASQGIQEVQVSPIPNFALYVTGSELQDRREALSPGEIYNSNGPMLKALAQTLGAEILHDETIKDEEATIRKILAPLPQVDGLIFTGGISMGEKDDTLKAFEAMGGKLLFQKVEQRPGHPLSYGLYKDKPVLFLPGNPVSAYIGFYIYGGLMIKGLTASAQPWPPRITAILGEDAHVKKGKVRFLRVRCYWKDNTLMAVPLKEQGSHRITSLTQADALWETPGDISEIKKGTPLILYPLGGKHGL